MLRSDYLNPSDMRNQCGQAARRLEEDCQALEGVRRSIRHFAKEPELESEAFDALRQQLEDYETVIEAMRIANASDISDFQRLSGLVGNEVLDGENIFCQMENARRMKDSYQSEETAYRNRTASAQEPVLYAYYQWKARQYGQLALNSRRLYEKWREKTERFDEIAAGTGHLFTTTDGIGRLIHDGLSKIGCAFQNGAYVPDMDGEWRRQLKNAGIHLAMGYQDQGGDQNGPYLMWSRGEDAERELLRNLIHGYEEYAEYSDEEISQLLTKLDSEGCGYVAFANIIADEYRKKEEEFEQIFGFPLFLKNMDGTEYVNYNPLILDIYCASDNHNGVWALPKKRDVYDADEDFSATFGQGTSQNDRIYRFERYMAGFGIDVKIENIECGTDEVYQKCREETAQGNRIIISTCPVRLWDKDGEPAHMDGGHAMTVVGLKDDGRIEVTSWGEIYYITPEDTDYQKPEYSRTGDAYIKIQSVCFRRVE